MIDGEFRFEGGIVAGEWVQIVSTVTWDIVYPDGCWWDRPAGEGRPCDESKEFLHGDRFLKWNYKAKLSLAIARVKFLGWTEGRQNEDFFTWCAAARAIVLFPIRQLPSGCFWEAPGLVPFAFHFGNTMTNALAKPLLHRECCDPGRVNFYLLMGIPRQGQGDRSPTLVKAVTGVRKTIKHHEWVQRSVRCWRQRLHRAILVWRLPELVVGQVWCLQCLISRWSYTHRSVATGRARVVIPSGQNRITPTSW